MHGKELVPQGSDVLFCPKKLSLCNDCINLGCRPRCMLLSRHSDTDLKNLNCRSDYNVLNNRPWEIPAKIGINLAKIQIFDRLLCLLLERDCQWITFVYLSSRGIQCPKI